MASVVLVHTGGEPVGEPDLTALPLAGGPTVRVEVVVVDCGPPAATAAPAWAGRHDVTVVRGDEGMGLAAARNRGADAASGEHVAFVAPGVEAQPGWLERVVEVFEADGSLTCVAPALDGARPGALSFDGHPLAAEGAGAAAEVLYPPAEALVVLARAFRDVGGFDVRYERFGEEVELGWRLWLLGHRLRACPEWAVSLAAVTPPALPPDRRRFLQERNALSTVFTHYDDARLATALPAAVALALHRAALEGDDALAVARRAVDAFLQAVPELQRTRRRLQRARRRPDAELLRLFGGPLRPLATDAAFVAAHHSVLEAFALAERFGDRRRILVVTGDALSSKMAGPAIRAWHVADALAAEHEVQLVTTSGRCQITSPRFSVRAATDAELEQLETWCDLVVLQGAVLEGRSFLRDTTKVMVVDLYDPLHLEQLEAGDKGDAVRRASVRNATAVLNDQLARGDLFLCATAKQRDFWLGQMSAVGRINPLTYDEDKRLGSLITVVPFGLAADPPVPTRPALRDVVPGIAAADDVILWGGGIYNWFDPLTLVEAVGRLRHRRPRVRLVFMGLEHPNPEEPGMRMARATRELADALGLTGAHVFFNEGWVPYGERQNHLLEADVGVSTHLDHLETEFSFRTRILDYIWAGLPIVATRGDAFAELVERETLGLTVPPGDVEALEEALFRVLDDAELAALCHKNLEAVRPQFTWSAVLAPLLDFCRAPRRAPDLVDPEMAALAGGVVQQAPRGWRQDLVIALRHLRDGGPSLVAEKALSRLGHRMV